MIARLDQIIRGLMYILIFWLPYSAAVVEVCVIMALVVWLVKRSLVFGRCQSAQSANPIIRFLKAYRPVSNSLNRPIAFFLLFCFASSLMSDMSVHALKGLTTKTAEWFVIYWLVLEAFRDRRQIYTALGVLIFTSFSTAIDSFVQYYWLKKDIFNGRPLAMDGRATASFKAPSGLGGLFTIVLPLVIGLCVEHIKSGARRIGLVVVALTMGWSLFLSASRGAMLGIFMGIFFAAFILFYFCHRNKVKAYLVLTCIALMICAVSQVSLSNNRNFGFLSRGTSNFRLIVWEGTVKMIKARPWLGHGLNTFMEKFQDYRRPKVGLYYHHIMYSLDHPTYAHNCFLQMWAEAGIFALLAFLWIIRNLFRVSVGRIRSAYARGSPIVLILLALLSGLFAFLTHSFFDTNFYSLQLSSYFWYMAGLMMAMNHILIKQEEGTTYAKA